MVRTGDTWDKLTSIPHPVMSSDKVVTRQGRAEITLVDGGIIRLDIDSNLSLVQRDQTGGFMVRKKMTARQVNLLVGGIWFEVKVQKGEAIRFRTPTMTAGIRGTSGEMKVALNGQTHYGLATGEAETIGDYAPLTKPKALQAAQITTQQLPSSDPEIDNSRLQKAAIEAVKISEKASSALSKAEEWRKIAEAALERAAKSQDRLAQMEAEAAKVAAAAALSEAEATKAKLNLTLLKEKLIEAQRFQETEEITLTNESLEKATQTLVEAEDIAAQQQQLAKEAKESLTEMTGPELQKEEQNQKQEQNRRKVLPAATGRRKEKAIDNEARIKKTPHEEAIQPETPLDEDLLEEYEVDLSTEQAEDPNQQEEKNPPKKEPPAPKGSWFQRKFQQVKDFLANLWQGFLGWWKRLLG